MSRVLPRERDTADRRVIARILELSFGKSNAPVEMMDKISRLYGRMGGSWVSFYGGDPEHIKLLKSCAKTVVKSYNKRSDE
jgi:hypothetical protein